jgi:polysaccharide biosynthesis/export protein
MKVKSKSMFSSFKKAFPLVLFMTLVLFSCKTKERMVYFQGEDNRTLVGQPNYTPTFKPDDFLSVVITSSNPESAIPFNYPKELITQAGGGNAGYLIGRPVPAGFLVDADGYVTLPIVGKVLVAGKSRSDVVNELLAIYGQYLKDPVVQIQIQNFKITVLGDVERPGTFQIPNERITILEAIGLAGDLNMTGNRQNILVLRDRNGEKQEFRLDITSKDILTSPVYYLEQNDVVYIEPNSAARSQGTFWRTNSALIISTTSTLFTMVFLIVSRIN